MCPKVPIHYRAFTIFYIVLGLMVSGLSFALPSDAEQHLNFNSDEWYTDPVNGTLVYDGAVIMQQGSMKILADKIVIYRDKSNHASKVIAIGQPAHFQQQPDEKSKPVVAQAQRLEYEVSTEVLMMIGDAELDQEGSRLSANTIEYDVKKASFRAASDAKGSDTKKRVHMVVPPKVLKSEDE